MSLPAVEPVVGAKLVNGAGADLVDRALQLGGGLGAFGGGGGPVGGDLVVGAEAGGVVGWHGVLRSSPVGELVNS